MAIPVTVRVANLACHHVLVVVQCNLVAGIIERDCTLVEWELRMQRRRRGIEVTPLVVWVVM